MSQIYLVVLFSVFLTVPVLLCLIYLRACPRTLTPEVWNPLPEARSSKALVLYSKNGPYTLNTGQPHPQISERELLIRNRCVGLNPIDWKCVSYGFGIHTLPWISGRECAGEVEEVGAEVKGWRRGDKVWVCSTDYRDNRTSTFQDVSLPIPLCDAWISVPSTMQRREEKED